MKKQEKILSLLLEWNNQSRVKKEELPSGGWRGGEEELPPGGWRGGEEELPPGGLVKCKKLFIIFRSF